MQNLDSPREVCYEDCDDMFSHSMDEIQLHLRQAYSAYMIRKEGKVSDQLFNDFKLKLARFVCDELDDFRDNSSYYKAGAHYGKPIC